MSPYRQVLLSKTGRRHISTSPVETNDLKNMGYRVVEDTQLPDEPAQKSTVDTPNGSSPAASSQVTAPERPFRTRKSSDESKSSSE